MLKEKQADYDKATSAEKREILTDIENRRLMRYGFSLLRAEPARALEGVDPEPS
jgi:hypothetical protein